MPLGFLLPTLFSPRIQILIRKKKKLEGIKRLGQVRGVKLFYVMHSHLILMTYLTISLLLT